MFQAYADGSALECIALQAAMVMPVLLLQKPYPKSKAADHTKHLERCLQLWNDGDLESLMNKGHTIQRQFIQGSNYHTRTAQQTTRIFASRMMEENVRATLRLISEDHSNGLLHLDSCVESDIPTTTPETVHDVILRKHPPRQLPKPSAIITPDAPL